MEKEHIVVVYKGADLASLDAELTASKESAVDYNQILTLPWGAENKMLCSRHGEQPLSLHYEI